jgi:hypothetical protein
MRTTYPRSAVQPHDWTGKQWDFDVPFPVAAGVAGKLGMCQPVVDELNNRLSKLAITACQATLWPTKVWIYCSMMYLIHFGTGTLQYQFLPLAALA